MSNGRNYSRIPMEIEVKLSHSSFGELVVHTKDISDTGLFLTMDTSLLPPLGSIMRAQVVGMAAEPPIVGLEIVRIDPAGVGVKFVKEWH